MRLNSDFSIIFDQTNGLMATAILTLAGDFQLTCSTNEQVNIFFTSDTVSFAFNPTTGGGISDFISNLSGAIAARGGTVTTDDVTYDDGLCLLTVNFVFTMDTDNLMGAALVGVTTIVPTVEIQSDEPIEECTACQELTLAACQDAYTITAGLTADTDYVVILTSAGFPAYTQTVTSDVAGDIVIDTELLPEGYTTPENSPVQVIIKETADATEVEVITSGSSSYPCANLNFEYRTDTTPIIATMIIITDSGEALTDDTGEEIEYD